MNLAPFKYRSALARDGGPILRIESGSENICGQDLFSAHAFLREELRSRRRSAAAGDVPDGAGTGEDLDTARFRAISEALERWAFRDASRDAAARRAHGFDYDPTTNGMGAFPGLFAKEARQSAYREAVERHCLILWWEGWLPVRSIPDPFPEVRGVEIENPFSEDAMVLVWRFADFRYYQIGFGIGRSVAEAGRRAAIEMHRTGNIVARHYERQGRLDECAIDEVDHVFERRMLHFSRPRGFAEVLRRIERGPSKSALPSAPRVIANGQVNGPWDQYLTVWRTVFEQPSREFASERADYFFW